MIVVALCYSDSKIEILFFFCAAILYKNDFEQVSDFNWNYSLVYTFYCVATKLTRKHITHGVTHTTAIQIFHFYINIMHLRYNPRTYLLVALLCLWAGDIYVFFFLFGYVMYF